MEHSPGFGYSPLLERSRRLSVRFSNRQRSMSFERGHVKECARSLGALAVCFITYFNVSGGPWGSEGIISYVGPLPGLIGVVLFAVFWALPMALVTAELSSAYPDDGGYSIWVAEAYGDFWGFQESYWSWVSGVIDNAVYPVLSYQTLVQILGADWQDEDEDVEAGELAKRWGYLAKLGLAILYTLPNLFTIHKFGPGLTVLAFIVLSPFVVLSVNAIFFTEHANWGELLKWRSGVSWSKGWGNLLTVLYWNFSGFDCISTCAGEVKNPATSYVRGLLSCVVFVFCTYMFTLPPATAVNQPDWKDWQEGWFSRIANEQVGQWLAIWMVVVSFVGNAGMYAAEMFEDSFQLVGMAETGLVPKVFATRHRRWGTPYVSILFSLVIIGCLVSMDLLSILVVSNFFSVISSILELTAFLKLRLMCPDLPRPFSVPISSISGVVVMLLFPFAAGGVVLVNSLLSSWTTFIINVAALVFGIILFHVIKHRGHIQYQYTSSSSHVATGNTPDANGQAQHEPLVNSVEDLNFA